MTGSTVMSSLMFLSQGVQFVLFLLFVAVVLIFIKGAHLEQRMKHLEDSQSHYVTLDDYYETVNNLVDERMRSSSELP